MQQYDSDLTYNPFDDGEDSIYRPSTNSNPLADRGRQFGSTLISTFTSAGITRRKSSGGDSVKSASSGSTIRRRSTKRSRSNSRIGVEDEVEPSQPNGHPLKSAALRAGEFENSGVTRPHLSRVVQNSSMDSSRWGGSAGDSDDDTFPTVKEPETEVLVHEVQLSDSLAGVSLKYGIDLIELRRANQLWANDSIHLRKTLLIPLRRASRAHEFVVRSPIEPIDPPESNTASSTPSSTSILDSSEPLASASSSTSTQSTNVRRVPLSQLSYFPPSSNPLRSGLPIPPTQVPTVSTVYSTPYSKVTAGPPRGTAAPTHSLTSLLNALPIAASTRDEIVSRLSLDSTASSSSYSDRGRSSRTSSSDDELGHEMDHVNKISDSGRSRAHRGPSVANPDSQPAASSQQQTPRPAHRLKDTSLRDTATPKSRSTLTTSERHASHGQRLSTSPPAAYVPHGVHNQYVRTAQMEPSPGMKFPLVRSTSDSGYPTPTRNGHGADAKHALPPAAQPYGADHGRAARTGKSVRTGNGAWGKDR